MARAFLGLGSNLGDRVGYIQQAVQLLKDNEQVEFIQSSSFYETEPVGLETDHWFVNAVIEIETDLQPEILLGLCNEIESMLGRVREYTNGSGTYQSRTIDIDILFYDDLILSTEKVIIPHPRVHERAYALVPMLEIASEFTHPVIGQHISYIHKTLFEPEEVYLYGTRRENKW
jgi:2-amino-4-hydroxy-6-hydroxymethyldihydropteridine diphosphokinase